MRSRSNVGLVVLGIATTFTWGASAGLLEPSDDSAPTSTFAATDIGERRARQPARGLDSDDPWTSTPMEIAAPPPRHGPAPLDTANPWTPASPHRLPVVPVVPAAPLDESDPWQGVPPAPATRAVRPSHDGLREAIDRAMKAGDHAGAAALQETLDSAL